MTGPKQVLLCTLLMLLMVIAAGCGNENLAAEELKQPLAASSSKAGLPSWLLVEHRSETLSDEELGFVVIESEYRIALEKEKNENDDLATETVEKKVAISPTVKANSNGLPSGNLDDNWKSSVITPQQSPNSGSWWEQPFSSSSSSGQLEHRVLYNLED